MFWGLKESEILLAEVRKKQNCRFLLRSGCYSTVGVQLGTEYSTVSLYSTVSFVSGAGCREFSMAGGKGGEGGTTVENQAAPAEAAAQPAAAPSAAPIGAIPFLCSKLLG